MGEAMVCHSDWIERFLADELDDEQQRALERHLDSCDACCRVLKERAAEADWWHDARSFLASEPSSRSATDPPHSQAPTATGGRCADERNWSLDFLGPTDDPDMLGRFGGYEISGVIGRGGMGIVLKGFDAALNRYVAIKVLSPYLAEGGSARRRFAREAQAAAAVVHENVIAIHGVSEERGLPYLVMPYFRGVSLQKRLNQQGPLATCEVLRIGMHAAAGLAAAHAQGLVHRDIKPANILLSESVERVKITDFGLARAADDASLTHSGITAGTPQYMSPEQARGESVDARSDLFSLGSMMYAMCTGHPPFRAETSYGVLRRISDSEPRPIRELSPETPEWLCKVIEKLHAKSLEDRFQSAAEVADAFEQCLAHVQNPSRPLPGWLAEKGCGCRSWRRWAAAAAGLMAALFAMVALTGTPKQGLESSNDQPEPAAATENLSTSPLAATQADPSPILWNDGTSDAIELLRAEVRVLDSHSQGLWTPVLNNTNHEE